MRWWCNNENKWYNSTIIHIISLISYPRVGHDALPARCHVMTLLFALSEFYSRYDKVPLMTLLLQTGNNVYNVTKHAIKYFLSRVLRQKEHTLFHIMHYYDTIITIIDLIHIITWILVRQSTCGKMAKQSLHMAW